MIALSRLDGLRTAPRPCSVNHHLFSLMYSIYGYLVLGLSFKHLSNPSLKTDCFAKALIWTTVESVTSVALIQLLLFLIVS